MTIDCLELRARTLSLRVVPKVGGSIARFDRLDDKGHRSPIFRGIDEDYQDVLNAACFPLVPYSNRIRNGYFDCDGQRVVLSPNMAGEPNPLHGQGWRSAWRLATAASVHRLELVYEHPADEWPWSYEARQSMALDDGGLTMQLSCRNLSANPMPCGLALHPYFPCTAETILDTVVTSAWTVDEQVLPLALVPAENQYDLRERRICGQGLDNGFEGWGQRALVIWPDSGIQVEMSSSDASRFQVYSPSSGGLFVAEPVQSANAALNRPQADWSEAGLCMLAHGEQLHLAVRFAVTSSR